MRNGSATKVAGKKQDVITHFSSSVINQLPAGHALIGCDTVAKVGTTAAMLKLLIQENEEQIVDFGSDRMDGDMLAAAEMFLSNI